MPHCRDSSKTGLPLRGITDRKGHEEFGGLVRLDRHDYQRASEHRNGGPR